MRAHRRASLCLCTLELDQDRLLRGAQQLRLRPRILVEAENPAVLLAAVRTGSAVTTLPAPAAVGMQGVHAASLPLQQDDRLLIDACWLKAAPLSKAAQALLAHLQAALKGRGARQSSARRIKGASARAAVRRSAASKPA